MKLPRLSLTWGQTYPENISSRLNTAKRDIGRTIQQITQAVVTQASQKAFTEAEGYSYVYTIEPIPTGSGPVTEIHLYTDGTVREQWPEGKHRGPVHPRSIHRDLHARRMTSLRRQGVP